MQEYRLGKYNLNNLSDNTKIIIFRLAFIVAIPSTIFSGLLWSKTNPGYTDDITMRTVLTCIIILSVISSFIKPLKKYFLYQVIPMAYLFALYMLYVTCILDFDAFPAFSFIIMIFIAQGIIKDIKSLTFFNWSLVLLCTIIFIFKKEVLINKAMFLLTTYSFATVVYISNIYRILNSKTLYQSEIFRKTIFNEAVDTILILSIKNGKILDCNTNAKITFNTETKGEIIGKSFFDMGFIYSSMPEFRNVFNLLDKNVNQTFSTEVKRINNKKEKWYELSLKEIKMEKDKFILCRIYDINEIKQYQNQIEYLANHDNLTGLPNRRLGKELLYSKIIRSESPDDIVAVMFMDLDGFKIINDSMGHDAGDNILVIISERLNSFKEHSLLVSRLGGDEYMIILDNIKSIREIIKIANKILDAVNTPMTINEKSIQLSGSIGISLYPDDSRQIHTLLKYADIAMYKVKENHGKDFMFFHKKMLSENLERIELEVKLRKAIENDEFIIYLQPQYNFKEKAVTGAEALIRWLPPDGELVYPSEFIEVAEKSNLINLIDQNILRLACLQIKEWELKGYQPVPISVNISSKHFNDSTFIKKLDIILTETKINTKYINIEVTESSIMEDRDYALDIFKEIKSRGIKISIDDFGTGHSSLSYLKHFPADEIKIDKIFIDGIGYDQRDEAIIKSIITMAKSLNLNLIAEGVEKEAQLDFLKKEGCYCYQGYYYSRPVNMKSFIEYL
jgi:diguanylate cyclase (GGDEF)-like protein/PAS domain S-box-containing protein